MADRWSDSEPDIAEQLESLFVIRTTCAARRACTPVVIQLHPAH
jgi:hypothetical protein